MPPDSGSSEYTVNSPINLHHPDYSKAKGLFSSV